MTDHGYARPDMLAETQWLAAHLQDDNLRVVDCDNREAYRRAHIPGAIPVRGHHYFKEEGTPHIMGPDQFTQTMGEMGIGDDTLVVAYDGFSGLYATRLWWALHYYGHTNVRVLNGGWDAWLAEGRPMTNAASRPAKATFTPQVHDDLIARWEQVQEAIAADTVLLDVRSDAETKKFKPADELRPMFEQVGVRPECEVVTY